MSRRLAIIVLAHDKPEALAALAARLQHPEIDLFVHVDAKSDVGVFKTACGSFANLHFVSPRVGVYWAGYSMVEAILASVRAALATGEYSYFCLISGADIPLLTASELVGFYATADRVYMDCLEIKESMQEKRYIKALHTWAELDNKYVNPRTRRRYPGIIRWLYRTRLVIRRTLAGKRAFIDDLTPWCGSAWWSLPDDCMRCILSDLDRRSDLVAFMRHCRSPEELVFQTVVMNSEFRSRIERTGDSEGQGIDASNNNLRYVDWSAEREQPAVLVDADYEKIRVSGAHFARKVQPQKSAALLQRLGVVKAAD